MESENYWKDHLLKALNDTLKDFVKPSKNIIIFIIAIIFIGSALGFTFDEIFIRIIFPIGGLVFLFLYIFCSNWMNISKRYYEENILLKEQQNPKLQIGFDLKKFPSCLDDTSNIYEHPQTGEPVNVAFSQKWRIFVYNSSPIETIKNVEVKLAEIDKCLPEQDSKLPVHLKLMHDTEPYKYLFDINPKSRRFFDVIECFMKSTVQINRNHFVIQHIEEVYPYLDFDIDKDPYKITIEVEGNNITCEPKDFMIGLRNDAIKMWEA